MYKTYENKDNKPYFWALGILVLIVILGISLHCYIKDAEYKRAKGEIAKWDDVPDKELVLQSLEEMRKAGENAIYECYFFMFGFTKLLIRLCVSSWD